MIYITISIYNIHFIYIYIQYYLDAYKHDMVVVFPSLTQILQVVDNALESHGDVAILQGLQMGGQRLLLQDDVISCRDIECKPAPIRLLGHFLRFLNDPAVAKQLH